MTKTRGLGLVFCLLLIIAVPTAWGQQRDPEAGWNPFGPRRSPAATHSRSSKGFFTLPKLELPSPLPQRAAGQPSMLSTWNRNAKNMLVKTREVLLPWTAEETKRRPSRPRVIFRRASNEKPSRGSFLPSFLFPKPEEPRPSRSIQDFLSQERPGF